MTRRAIVLALALALVPRRAAAAEPDTSYGRIDGDVSIGGGGGLTFGPRGPRALADARLRYLSTAGLFAAYEDGPVLGSAAEPQRALALGVELRPLFLGRWLKGWEIGIAHLDLLLDSLALELGAAFLQPAGRSAAFDRPALQLGVGLELPLLGRASGPFLGAHGGARFSEEGLAGGPIDGPLDRGGYLAVVLGWHQIFGAHVVDLGDRSAR